jgi:ABC-type lipoprotein export system ATPase subunit
MDAPLYELRGVTRTFRRGDVTISALESVDLTIASGEVVAVEGPSGSGKTTLLQLLGALDRPSGGHVFFEGRDLNALGDRELADIRLRAFGFVFQTFNLIPTLTALQNVEAKLAPTGVGAAELRQRALSLLGEVGLAERAEHLPSQLSGGEQQRVAIARALSTGPRVVLADEPTGNLDSTTGAEIVELLTRLSEEHEQTVLLVTHDHDVAARARRVLRMQDGRLLGEAPPRLPPEVLRTSGG